MKHSLLLLLTIALVNFSVLKSQPFTENTSTAFVNLYQAQSVFVDYDNDGDKDLFLVGFINTSLDAVAKLYKNKGNGTFEDSNIALPHLGFAGVDWGDYDNDGDLDLFLTGKEFGYIKFWLCKNNGDGTFTPQLNTGLMGNFHGEAHWGDYDNDGLLDLLLHGRVTNGFDFETSIFKNNGNGTFTKQTSIVFDPILISAKWIDYNNDGLLDVSLSGTDRDSKYSTQLYKNNGNNTFTKVLSIPNIGGTVSWADYDKDGDMDMLICGYTSSNYISYVYRNDGDAVFSIQSSIALTGFSSLPGSLSNSWNDIDNDGYLDITLSGNTGTGTFATKVYLNDGNGVFTEDTSFPFVQLGYSSFNYVDVDNDGDLDFFQTGYNGSATVTKLFTNLVSKKIVVSNTKCDKGKTFEIPISTSNISLSENIVSFQFNLAYNAAKLQYIGNSLNGTMATGGNIVVNSSSADSLKISCINSNPLSGAGNILKLQFKALDFDTTYLNLSKFYYNTTPIANIKNGTVIIADTVAPRANITLSHSANKLRYGDTVLITATFTEAMRASPLPKISLSGAVTLNAREMDMVNDTVFTYKYGIPKTNGDVTISLSDGKDIFGNVLFPAPITGRVFTITPLVYGDIDDNGQIMAYDAAMALLYSVGKNPVGIPNPWEVWRKTCANVDNTGDITANDAALILKYSANIIKSFPANTVKSTIIGNTDVNITLENNNLVFRSTGELFSLNIIVNSNFKALGKPIIVNDSIISAYNISNNNYSIGLATAFSPKDNSIFMKIPLKNENGGIISFDMMVNADNITKLINTTITSISAIGDGDIFIYPNPVVEILNIQLPSNIKNTTFVIVNTKGEIIMEQPLKHTENAIDVSFLPCGIYIAKITSPSALVSHKLIKK